MSGCLRNSEICFAWCQSLAFLLLCQKLKQLDTITRKSDFVIKNQGIYYGRLIDIVLFTGLAVTNIFTIVYIVLVCVKSKDRSKDMFIRIEIVSWVASTISSFILIAAGTYTVFMLRKLYGNAFNRTTLFLTLIVIIFCLAFGVKSIYEWRMYSVQRP